MEFSAKVENSQGNNDVVLRAGEKEQSIIILPKHDGFGSSVSGAELLFLALATCYCNDIYREARKQQIEIDRVVVEVTGEFETEGATAANVRYRAQISSSASKQQILELMIATDKVAEIQNTVRAAIDVELEVDGDAPESS